MLKRLALAAFLLLSSAAAAQTPLVPISGLPPATTPLTGGEQVPIVQSGVTRRVSANQMPIIPPTAISIGGVLAATAPANQVMVGISAGTGLPIFAQQSFANLSGQIAPAQIPAPTETTFGGMVAATAPAHQYQTGNLAGVPQFAQPTFSDLGGQIAAGQVPNTMGPTINGVSCPVTGTCNITAAAAGIAVGTTAITGGSPNGPLTNNGGVLGNLPTIASGVYVTNASGVPSISTTLPGGLTIPSPVFTGTVTGNGTIPNAALVNSTISGTSLGQNLPALTLGVHLTGTSYNGTGTVTAATDATNANTAGTIVARDASGNFAAGTVTASVTGLASLNLPLAGGTMAGGIAMGGYAITGAGAIGGTALSGTSVTDSGLAAQGTTCNNAAGLLSTSATGCPGTTQSAATGGTGQASYTVGDILYATSTTALAKLSTGTSGYVLTSNGAGAAPSYQAQTGGSSGTSSAIPDQDRRNSLLDRVNTAKALGTALLGVGTFTDGFADTSGSTVTGGTINTASKNVTPTSGSTVTSAGPQTLGSNASSTYTFRTYIAQANLSNTGNTTTLISMVPSTAGSFGPVYVQTAAAANSYAFSTTPVPCLFSGNTTTTTTVGTTITCAASFTIPASGNGIVLAAYTNSGGWQYGTTAATGWSSYYTTGNDAATVAASGYTADGTRPDLFSVVQSSAGTQNLTLLLNAQASPASVSNARAAVTLNNSASPTWGTSETLEVTTNGGTNWTTVTPVSAGPVQAGSGAAGQGAGVLWEAPDTPTTAGASFQARYKTLQNQARTVFQLSTTVH